MNHDDMMLDRRTREDLCDRVQELAASYTPEWNFDRKDPDVGSAIALIYADQMSDNIRRMNQLMDKYHTEFTNLLGLTLKPAYPASGVVVVDLAGGTAPGVPLPRGTRLMAENVAGGPVLFETTSDVYLTNAQITDILSVSGTRGCIQPLRGGPRRVELVPGDTRQEGPEPEEAEKEAPPMGTFRLFDYEEPGIARNALLLYHRAVLDVEPGTALAVALVTPEGYSLAKKVWDPDHWRWSYYDGQGLTPFDRVEVREGFLYLTRSHDAAPLQMDGAAYHLICLEALDPIQTPMDVCDIRFCSQKDPASPALMLRDGEELEANRCLPFGETISVFDECYICDQQVFSQKDATVHLAFDLSSQRKIVQLTAAQVAEDLKVIKPKPRAVQYQVATTAPERIAIEYYNGSYWRRLPCSTQWSNLMDGTHEGHFDIEFQCPDDWTQVPINGYQGLCLRLRVIQADNCYLMPCEHTAPVLENVTLAYVYDQGWKQPQVVKTVCGTCLEDQTPLLLQEKPITVFRPLAYPEASLYLGFNKPLDGSPISILFDVEENVHFHMDPVIFEYSTRTGFKQMKVVDGTRTFAGAGTVLFMPPTDFAPMEVEGLRRRWIRLRGGEDAVRGYHAPIRSIRLNAVAIQNCQTQPEEKFYLRTTTANLEYHLSAQNILSADVYVNEMGEMTRFQMRQLLEETPDQVMAKYDFMGEIVSFFVRWTEVDSFDSSQPGDRHYMIDRARNVLVFGDGVHVRIPQARQGPVVLVRAVSCDGSRGNVPAGAIGSFYGSVMYVTDVTNPVATFAGSDLEDLESARRRGANLLSSRGRLVSERDFIQAVRAFSNSIEKVRCMAGWSIDGRPDPSLITIAVMTRDYADGAYAFNNIREPLCRSLLERCEATVTQHALVLAEPIYMEISVSVWIRAESNAQAFEIQNLLLENIRDFLDPLPANGYSGWDIGQLPTEGQLKMLLQSIQFQGRLSRVIAVAKYADRDGVHETSLDQLPNSPFAIGVSGEHHVYIEFQ